MSAVTLDPFARMLPYDEAYTTSESAASSGHPQPEPAVPRTAAGHWPLVDRDAALHGLAGEIVQTVEPHSESDPVALLLTLLVAVGNAAGPGPHFRVGGARHPARLFTVLVGETSRSRKGQSKTDTLPFLEVADPDWACENMVTGLSTGEGLINRVRDATPPKGDKNDGDPGVTDKRLWVIESEWAKVAKVGQRDGNTLSPIVREAWDNGTMQVLTKGDPLKASDTHISILGHITVEELRRVMTDTEAANGIANRHLFALVRRARLLPHGGDLPDSEIRRLGAEIGDALRAFRRFERIERSPDANRLWEQMYAEMAATDVPGMVGAITGRAEAQVLRLSIIYALLEKSAVVEVPHLHAAYAVWNYCEQSVAYIWGDKTGDRIADRLLDAVRGAGPEGLDGTAQRRLFSGHVTGERIESARRQLEDLGLAKTTTVETGGRPKTVTAAVGNESAQSAQRSPP